VAPSGTTVNIYTRSADIESDLTTLVPLPNNGMVDTSSKYGSWFDIVVETNASLDLTLAPQVNSITLSFSAPGSSSELIWNKDYTDIATGQQGWYTATTMINTLVGSPYSEGGETKNTLSIADTSRVGEFIFLRNNNGYSAYSLDDSDEVTYADIAQINNIPFSPVSVWNGGTSLGFNSPTDMVTLNNSNIVVADTGNDRIVEIDSNFNVLRTIQGNIRLNQTVGDFVALCASYNPSLGILWIAFSQNITIIDPTKIFLVSGKQSITLGDSGVNTIPFNPIGGNSATIQSTFSAAINTQIQAWTGTLQVIITNGAIKTTSTGGTLTPGGTPTYNLPTGQYQNLGINSFAGTMAAEQGIPSYTSSTSNNGDYNGDGKIDTVLQGPGGQYGTPVTLNVYTGNILYDNIYNPISIQVKDDGSWIVGTCGEWCAIKYDSNNNIIWAISSSVASFTPGLLGQAYDISTNTAVQVLFALPANSSGNGQILLINHSSTADTPIMNLSVPGDVIRAIPYGDNVQYWALINDRLNNGKSSKLIRIDSTGRIHWTWGQGELTSPTGLKLLINGDVLISE